MTQSNLFGIFSFPGSRLTPHEEDLVQDTSRGLGRNTFPSPACRPELVSIRLSLAQRLNLSSMSPMSSGNPPSQVTASFQSGAVSLLDRSIRLALWTVAWEGTFDRFLIDMGVFTYVHLCGRKSFCDFEGLARKIIVRLSKIKNEFCLASLARDSDRCAPRSPWHVPVRLEPIDQGNRAWPTA